MSWEGLDQSMKMQPNTVISILSQNSPVLKSDYKLQGKPRREGGDLGVNRYVFISSVLSLIVAARGISPGPEKSSFQQQKGSYSMCSIAPT